MGGKHVAATAVGKPKVLAPFQEPHVDVVCSPRCCFANYVTDAVGRTLSDAHQLCSELDTRGVPCFPVVEGLYPNHTRSPLPLRAAAVTILTMSDATDLSEIWPRSPVLFRFRPRGSASFAEEDADRCPKFVVMDPSTSVEATLFTLRYSSKSCSKMKKRQSTGNLLDLIDSQMTSLGYKS